MKRMIVAIAAMLLFEGPVQAQPSAPPPSAAAEQANPAKLALARKFVEVMRLKQTMQTLTNDLTPILREQRAEDAELSAEEHRLLLEAVDESVDEFQDKMVEKAAPLYAAEFTETELQAAIDFYSGPGQAFLDKTPQLSAATAEMVRDLLPELERDIFVRFCRKVDCLAPERAEPARQPS